MNNGGTISGNTNTTNDGGVYVAGNGKFDMNGGTISGNTRYGVYVANSTYLNFDMKGGTISGNTVVSSGYSGSSGGGVFVSNNSFNTFTKTGGTITGYASDTVNGNVVKDSSGVVQSNSGHAVYVDSNFIKRRETTAGPDVNLDPDNVGAAGGWQ